MFHHTRKFVEGYRTTIYCLHDDSERVHFVLDRRSVLLDRFLGRRRARYGAYLSAFNPESRPTPTHINRRAQRRMQRLLRVYGCRFRRGIGHAENGSWSEEGLFAYPMTRPLAAWIGRLFRQNAYDECRRSRPPRLVALR